VSSASEQTGQKLTEEDNGYDALVTIYLILCRALDGGFTTKSKFSRDMANIVAIAATEGLITTRLSEEHWGNTWFLTEDGYEFMKEIEDEVEIIYTPEDPAS